MSTHAFTVDKKLEMKCLNYSNLKTKCLWKL